MKCVVLLVLVAFAGATPLTGWHGEGHHQSREWGDSWGHQNTHKEAVVHKLTDGALQDQVEYTHGAIKNLQWELHQQPQHWGGYSSHGVYEGRHDERDLVHQDTAEAIKQLQEDLKHHHHESGEAVHHLHDTINNVHHHVPTVSGDHEGGFKKLIEEHTEQDIENQISHHHHWAQQLQQQRHFVDQQKQQVEAQQYLVQRHGSPEQVQQLKEAHHHLQLQEYHLIHEQLAHHLAELQLQEALVHKEQQILEDTVSEHVHEQAAHGDFGHKYWSY